MTYTSPPRAESDDSGWSARAIAFLAASLILAFGIVIALLYLGSTKTKAPKGPVLVGFKAAVLHNLEEGPLLIADLEPGDGKEKSFNLDLEDGKIVALKVAIPNRKNCNTRYSALRHSYIDCDGKKIARSDLARFPVTFSAPRDGERGVYVDIHRTLPPPSATGSSTTG